MTAGPFDFQMIRTAVGFRRLRPHWQNLLNSSTMDDYYLTHEWLQLWLDYFHPRGARVLLLWESGALACAVPMVLSRLKFCGTHIWMLTLTRDWYSPLGAILCAKRPEEGIPAVLHHMIASRWRWDVVDFDGLPSECHTTSVLLSEIAASQWPFRLEDSFGNWALTGVQSWEDYWKDRSRRKLRRKSITYRDRLLEWGELRSRIISPTDEQALDNAFKQFLHVYQKSWKKDIEQHPEFLKSTMRLAANNNALRVAFLDLDDKPIAAWYAFLYRSTAYLPRTGYDSRFRRLMPGFVLLEDFLRHLIQIDKVQAIDFQHGDEPYKKDWATQRRLRKRLIVANPQSRLGRLYLDTEYKYKPKLKAAMLWQCARRARDGVYLGVGKSAKTSISFASRGGRQRSF